jgi:hypothetical protein
MKVAFAPIGTGKVTLVSVPTQVTLSRKLNGSGNADVTIPVDGHAAWAELLGASQVWGAVMLVLSEDMRTCLWGGPVTRREISSTDSNVRIAGEEWEAWLNRVWCEPRRTFAGSWLEWPRFAAATGWTPGSVAPVTDPNWSGVWRHTTGEAAAAVLEAVAVRANQHPNKMPIRWTSLRVAGNVPVGLPFSAQWSKSQAPNELKPKAWTFLQEIIDTGSDFWIEPVWHPNQLWVQWEAKVGAPYRVGHAEFEIVLGKDFSELQMVELGEQQATVWHVAGRGASYAIFPPEGDPAYGAYRLPMLLDGDASYETRPVEIAGVPLAGLGGVGVPADLGASEQTKMWDRAVGLWLANGNTPMSVENITLNLIYASDTNPEWKRATPWQRVTPGDMLRIYIPAGSGEWWSGERTFRARVMEMRMDAEESVELTLTREPDQMPQARAVSSRQAAWRPQRTLVGTLRRMGKSVAQGTSNRA